MYKNNDRFKKLKLKKEEKKKRKKKKRERGKLQELQNPIAEAEVYNNNKKCD